MRKATRAAGLQAGWPAAKTYCYASTRPDDGPLWRRLREWLRNGAASATVAWGCYWLGKRSGSIGRSFTGFLQGGAVDGAQAWWPQAGTGHEGADVDPAGSEPAVVARLRRIDYNTNRPHTSLNGLTPTEFATRPLRGRTRTDSTYKRGQTGGAGQSMGHARRHKARWHGSRCAVTRLLTSRVD